MIKTLQKLVLIIISFIIPTIFNTMLNLSDKLYYTNLEANVASVVSIIGAVGVVFLQTYGAYKLINRFNEV